MLSLAELKSLKEKITPGPWKKGEFARTTLWSSIKKFNTERDLELVSLAPELLDELIEALETLKTFGVESGKFCEMYNHVSGEGRRREREELKKQIEKLEINESPYIRAEWAQKKYPRSELTNTNIELRAYNSCISDVLSILEIKYKK